MKRNLLHILIALLPVVANAYDAKIDGIYYNFSGNEAEVTYRTISYKCYSGDVVIPLTVTYSGKTYSVTGVGKSAFYDCSGLTSITIPKSVTSIGHSAFKYCSSLTSIIIPESVTSISNNTFEGCSNLTSIIIPNSVTSIGSSAFEGCSGMTSITIGNGVTRIGDYAFYECSGLTSITIPNSVTSIGEKAFAYCTMLTHVICSAEKVPMTSTSAFNGVDLQSVCLHVPSQSIYLYKKTEPWSSFGSILNFITYALIYKIDDKVYKSYQYTEGQDISPEPAPTKEGYTFSGWSEIPKTMPNHDVVITGSFSINYYVLTYIVDGEVYKTFSLPYGSTITPEPLPQKTKEGYTYKWSGLPKTMPAHDVTVTGSFSINSYRLIYIVDGEEYKSLTVVYGTTITPEKELTKEGYTFSGWSEIPDKMPAHDVVVTGSFSINSYILSYMLDGEVYKTLSLQYGTAITPEPAPIKEGHTFSGWTGLPATMPAHDVIVTGSFAVNTYTLTYKVDGEVYKTISLKYGEVITPEPAPTKEGHTFVGWGGLPTTMPAHDVTVNASFVLNSYILTYKVDGEVYKTLSLQYGTAITPEPAPIKEGHTFSGWTGLPATMPAHDVTVIGSFNINSYTLTFMVDGKVYASYSLVYGSTLPSVTAPTKEGHTFVGWGGLPTTMPAHDIMVQAQWIINQYQITYIVDGKVYKSYEIDYHAAITPEPAPVRKGMTFSGWNNLPEIMPARDITISGTFAWTKKTISYVIYQVTDTLNNYVSVVGNNITSYSNVEAEILSSVEIEGESYKVNRIDNFSFNNRYYCLTSIIIPSSVTSIGDNAFYECNNVQFYVSRASYALVYVWNHFNTDPYEIGTGTMLSRPSLSALSTTQTSITYQINNFYPELEYEYMGEVVGENTYMIKGLRPDYTLTVPLKVLYADNSFSTSAYITTSPIDPKVVSKRITASSLTVGGSYTEGDAKVVSTTLTMDGRQMAENEGSIHGLKPNTSYTCKYSVVVEYGDGETYTYYDSKIINTSSLSLTTQQPKVVNVGNVIVSAESNLDDEETNIGFEWRRTDWTDDFASNTGTAYLYEGEMEGYIRNLYAEKLWKYRPYYESDSGNRYYGNWVGIDPTNTSYFEPTVHTYAQINVTGNTAEVIGYAMRGTDNVVSQGFMYWEGNTSVSLRRRAASVPDGAMVVNAKGNIMTATLKDLEYETTYNYVAFVTTSEGETFYGEMRTFSTSADPDGIEGVRASEEVVEVARYDLQGRKIAEPQKGINIIRYSDGSTRKVMVK